MVNVAANLSEATKKKEIVFLFFSCFWLAVVWTWKLMTFNQNQEKRSVQHFKKGTFGVVLTNWFLIIFYINLVLDFIVSVLLFHLLLCHFQF
jgi:hypothetical protein